MPRKEELGTATDGGIVALKLVHSWGQAAAPIGTRDHGATIPYVAWPVL